MNKRMICGITLGAVILTASAARGYMKWNEASSASREAEDLTARSGSAARGASTAILDCANIICTVPQDVKFTPAITGITGSGLTRTVTAQLTNTGNITTHNTRVQVKAFCDDKVVKLNGMESITLNVDIIKAGETLIRSLPVSLSPFAAVKLARNGGRLEFTITSDEGSETVNYELRM